MHPHLTLILADQRAPTSGGAPSRSAALATFGAGVFGPSGSEPGSHCALTAPIPT
jgi:hypothetical protein